VLLAGDFDHDLIQMPFIAGTGQPPPDPVGEVLAKTLRAHCRTLSWLTMMSRAASISSTMRRLSGKRNIAKPRG
jgi:hypothetical protein